MDPAGKVAMVSGGASGIGLATARLLASRGSRLLLLDRNAKAAEAAAQSLRAIGAEASFCETEVMRQEDLSRAIEFAQRQFGRIDICYNNAGVSERGQDFFDPASEAWQTTVDINLRAVMLATKLEVNHFRALGEGGVIINTGSMGGIVPMPTSPIYAATKAGVIQFTRSLAYLAGEDIRVNAICPSITDTPMVREGGQAAIDAAQKMLGGILQPEQIAEGVLRLIEDDTRAGAVMRVTVQKGIDYAFERFTSGAA
jgi:NAD(P)-dependent dehydrogenase (short-subunit alcohol dehydrogenase family)